MSKVIIVPTDFSKTADNALNYAIAFAKKEKASIILVHAFHINYIAIDVPADFIAAQISYTEEAAKVKLETLRKNITKHRIQCDYINEQALVVDLVNRVVKKRKPDFIIMGTKGASNIKATFLGSNTSKVIEKSSVPVIAVPQKAVYKNIKQITYATDYHPGDIYTVKKLIKVAATFNAQITFLHIAQVPFVEATEEKALSNFENKVNKSIQYKKTVFKLLYDQDTRNSLIKYVNREKPDLLVMTTKHRNLFEKIFDASVTKTIAYHTKLPLLAFHSK